MRWNFLMALVGLLCFAGRSLSAAQYQLEVIARPGDVVEGRTIELFSIDPTEVKINNDGEVAFFAYVGGPEGVGWSLMTQRRFIAGAGKVVESYVPMFNDEDHDIDLNERGEVVYTPILGPAHRGVFVNERLVFQVGDMIDGRTIEFIGRSPRINDTGTVVVEAWTVENPGPAILTQDRSIAETGQVVDGLTLGDVFRPHIGNGGEVIFFAKFVETNDVGILSPDALILSRGDQIGDYLVTRVDGFGGITDNGDAVIHAVTEGPNGFANVILVGDEIIWTSDDPLAGMDVLGLGGSNVVVNRMGDLAVLAVLDSGGGETQRAIFAADRLIVRDGDVIDGKVVQRVKPNFDMNDLGQVAFRVRFEDQTEAVVLATRMVPEPSGFALGLAGLAFALAGLRRAQQRSRRNRVIESPASPQRRGGDLPQDRQSGGVSCVCHRFVGGAT